MVQFQSILVIDTKVDNLHYLSYGQAFQNAQDRARRRFRRHFSVIILTAPGGNAARGVSCPEIAPMELKIIAPEMLDEGPATLAAMWPTNTRNQPTLGLVFSRPEPRGWQGFLNLMRLLSLVEYDQIWAAEVRQLKRKNGLFQGGLLI